MVLTSVEVDDLIAMFGAADVQATLAGEIGANPQLPPGRMYIRCNGHVALLNSSTCAVTLVRRPLVHGVYVVQRAPAGDPVTYGPNEGAESSSRKRAAGAPPADTAAASAAAVAFTPLTLPTSLRAFTTDDPSH